MGPAEGSCLLASEHNADCCPATLTSLPVATVAWTHQRVASPGKLYIVHLVLLISGKAGAVGSLQKELVGLEKASWVMALTVFWTGPGWPST